MALTRIDVAHVHGQRHQHRRSASCGSLRIAHSAPELPLKTGDNRISSFPGGFVKNGAGSGKLAMPSADVVRPPKSRLATSRPLGGVESLLTSFNEGNASQDMLAASDKYRGFLDPAMAYRNEPASRHRKPFRKWVQMLHRRRFEKHQAFGTEMPSGASGSNHRKSSSISSFAFVTNAREASMSLASTSINGRSRRRTLRSSLGQSQTDRSSRASEVFGRCSEDSHCQEHLSQIDPEVMERSLHRRRVLEELIKTEEGYIGDVRFLMNAYLTILASLPTLQAGLRTSINRNLTDIVELHESLLSELHKVVPNSEYTQLELPKKAAEAPVPTRPEPILRRHRRWKSLDAGKDDTRKSSALNLKDMAKRKDEPLPEEGRDGVTWLQQVPGMTSEPDIAAKVAQAFTKKMNRFFIYEEYGAQYELMFKDLYAAYQSISNWDEYQKGLETLGSCVGPSSQSQNSKKALTIGDLLTKPIQRVCRYPLLFSELLKYTPVCDCPYSYMEIENTLARMREVTGAMNRATDSVIVRATLEKTWLLQDRLVFPNQKFDALAKSRIRSLGHIQLCGVLHICWQTKDSVKGAYMVCLLYRDWLCLAVAEKSSQVYTLQAFLPLCSCSLEEADNGRGLQCHTAPYSWKLVFECDYQLYEIVMTACNPKEEWEWRHRLDRNVIIDDGHTQPEIQDFSFLALNIRSLGTVFGKPGTSARKLSIRRATTVGSKSPMCQVIVKNTSVEREDIVLSSRYAPINRSQSVQTTSRIPVLAPSRADRARLEALVSDVWSRDVLPFPGITVRARGERLVLSSASSAMRKLSVASLASTFSRRSGGRGSGHRRVASIGTSYGAGDYFAPKDRTDVGGVLESDGWVDDDQERSSDITAQMNTPVPEERREVGMTKHRSMTALVSANELADQGTMTGSFKRAVARLFDDNWQHQSTDTQSGLYSHESSQTGYGTPHGLDTKLPSMLQAEPRTQSMRSLHLIDLDAVMDGQTAKTPPLYGSPRENSCPVLPQQPSIRSLRRWSKSSVFHRGALSQSFRSLLN